MLENACFACPANEARLLAAAVTAGEPPLAASQGLVAWLASQLGLLSRQALITGVKKVGQACWSTLSSIGRGVWLALRPGCAARWPLAGAGPRPDLPCSPPSPPHTRPTAAKQDVLRALLAVLMNLTQDSRAGAAAVVEAGALQPVAALLAQMVRGGPKMRGVVGGREELAVWLDELRCD